MNSSRPKYFILAAVATFIFLFLARAAWVYTIASGIPLVDQWDSEIDRVFSFLVKGTLSLPDFFVPGNEHRTFFTRLINMSFFILNDYKVNYLPAIYFQQIFQVLSALVLLKAVNYKKFRPVLSLFFIVIYALPISYENFFWAYQSQVYLTILCTLISFWLLSRPDFKLSQVLIFIFLAWLNMANSLWIPLIGALICFYYYFHLREKRFLSYAGFFIFLGIFILKTIPFNPAHVKLQSKSVSEFLFWLKGYVNWPNGNGILLIWIPFVLSIFLMLRNLKSKKLDRVLIFSFLLFSWLALQILSASYGRKGEMQSRYNDYMIFGLLATLLLSSCVGEIRWKKINLSVVLFLAVLIGGKRFLMISVDETFAFHDRLQTATHLISCAISAENQKAGEAWNLLKQGPGILYPDSVRITEVLVQPQVLQMLSEFNHCP